MAERLRVLGLPELHAVSPPVRTPSIRSAVELSKEDLVSDAQPRGNFCSAEGDNSFHAAPRNLSNLDRAEFLAPPVITREEQATREMQERAISSAVAQDKTTAASARLAQAFPHVHVTNFVQLTSDAQPRPTQKTLVTRSSQPVPNAMYYAPFPGNDDPNASLNFPHDVFTSGDLSGEISRLQDEVALCRQRIASYPSEIQGMRAVMDRSERFRSELAPGFGAEKKKPNLDWRRALECLDRRRDVSLAEYDSRHRELHRAIKDLEDNILSCRSRDAAATARVSLLRELASVGTPAGPDVAPSYSRGWDEISRKEPNAPLEPAQPDLATRASKETNKSEPTFGLHGEMDEFRRLKVMYPTASTRELAEFQVFAKAMAAHREDGRGSEHRGGDNRGDTGDDQRRGRHNSREGLKDYRERRPDGRPSAGSRWDKKSDSSCSSSDSSRRDNRRRSHRRRTEINRDGSAESASTSRSPAPKQLPAPSLSRLQQVAFPTVHHPTPSEPASVKSSALLSEISSRPSQREDVNRKCYASLDTKGLMKLPSIPFDIADGNS